MPIDLPELSFPELVAWSPWLQDVFLNTYIASVYRMVKDKLHLTDHGKPAQWAARAVHADVVRRDFPDADDGLLDPVPLWISAGKPRLAHTATLRIAIEPAGAAWQLEVGGVQPRGVPHRLQAGMPSVFDPTDEALRKALLETLKPWLEQVHADFEARYGQRHRRPSTRIGWHRDVGVLYRYLYLNQRGGAHITVDHRSPGAMRKALRRLAVDQIGIDFPQPSRTRTRGKTP